MVKKIAYFTNIAPHYRHSLWIALASESNFEFHFFFGKTLQKGIKEIDFCSPDWKFYQNRLHPIRNLRIKGLLIWQLGVMNEVFRKNWDTFIFLGDMYVLSTWCSAIIARFTKKPVFFWGHGIYGNETVIKRFFRKSFLMLANKHFLYGNYAKCQMIKSGFDESKLYVIYNSLNYNKHLHLRDEVVNKDFYKSKRFFKNPNLPTLVFIGRLTLQKKLELLIQTVRELNADVDCVNLIIIGNGHALSMIADLSVSLKNTLHFYGPCYDEKEIGRLLANASLCVSPGNVGLTAIHSLSFGTPVITHNNFAKQMPEFEAIQEDITGAFFEENSVESLKISIRDWLDRHPIKKSDLISACYKKVDEFYNPYYQLKVFNLALIKEDIVFRKHRLASIESNIELK
jgi:glycosyltransferase involved in cell wall biosynthesis